MEEIFHHQLQQNLSKQKRHQVNNYPVSIWNLIQTVQIHHQLWPEPNIDLLLKSEILQEDAPLEVFGEE